ncbi:lysozyme inhibitor LprI family protein [Ramlibacter alkalitolerans]|uniref:Uncharacterized protein n=1 Tax=Ramlibacter alkalitolerans TaxID=2039631 RepID=A0ABS1JNY0_9BURK|nr:hypothetical protein [Ramlibacter alkalitolerans]MBL0425846.1 hypothetical protein [Ramlibacter alkalitolerans]
MARVFLSPATFVGGSLAGALLLAAWLGAFTRSEEPAPAPAAANRTTAPADLSGQPLAASDAVRADPQGRRPQAPATGQVQAVVLAETCPAQPLVVASGPGDGRFALASALSSGAQVEPSAYVTVARESAQQGHLRDAEVALLAACHLAEKGSGSHSVTVADLKSQMAQQYAAFAASQEQGDGREALLQRASALLSESAITYSAALGREASKTRLAEQRLASLRDPGALQRARADLQSEAGTRVMGAAESFAPTARNAAAARLISSDPELSQLERDMERLRAQASQVTRDPAGLHRRDSQALAQRDSACQDKACLLRWYAQRRSQLLDEF